ncbi:uncharacterized protein J8A68_002265 [[Candida] subhashii]|uniref:Uncharacterized protein n=1 Tax=[Candida] subhashii TaxID=561895 RepID=A0A8J5UQQ0_9ASCO|nr:uncharacterized protein J8A68_002265 [[Candida] subhashii]KAG7664202.1 hypothetical protein J8A68_002265 [[Candida] subhashii]
MNSQSISSATQSSEIAPGKLEKSDSVINLTKPELYGIYNSDSLFGTNVEDMDLYIKTAKPKEKDDSIPARQPPQNLYSLPLLVKFMILAASAFIYNEITKHINYSHFSDNKLANIPLAISNVFVYGFFAKFRIGTYTSIETEFGQTLDNVFALTVQGLAMSLIHPIMDYLLPASFSKRLLSSNPNPTRSTSYSNLFNDLIRSSITFLGISYAIRKIEWSSFLQVSIVWSLLNPGLWLLLDGTVSGFLASLIGCTAACVVIYLQNYDFVLQYSSNQEVSIALWLWIGSFFFCGIITFGKIGRGLFSN